MAHKTLTFINPSLSTQNVGDLFIDDSVKRILSYDRAGSIEIDPRKPVGDDDIDRINETDAAVIVGTNLWYRSMLKPGRWQLTRDQIERIRVPIIPMGIGTTRHIADDNAFDAETRDIIRLIHDRCAIGGARDNRTVEVLNEAGIDNVAMTGCPTLLRSLNPVWRLRDRKDTRDVTVTVRKGQRRNVRILLRLLRRRGLAPVVAAQQAKDRFIRRRIPFVQRGARVVYEYDLAPYLSLVDNTIGAIGHRLHGNMFHLSGGNPAAFFANCSRAQSFCETFALPCVCAEDHQDIPPAQIDAMIDAFLDPDTFAEFPNRYAAAYRTTVAFLDANGLGHNLSLDHSPSA